MRFLSFLNDFGFTPNRGTQVEHNPSLHQGQMMNDFNRHYVRNESSNLNSLQVTGLPGVESVKEAMDISSPMVSHPSIEKDDISKLQDKFNILLAKYNTTYKLFMERVIDANTIDKQVQQYFGQTITNSDGNYVYINDYGFTHKYSTDAWTNNNVSCPPKPTMMKDGLYKTLQSGPDIVSGQPCGIAGKNIKNIETKEYAWVDIKGYKHVYSDVVWNNKSSSCKQDILSITNEEYNAIPNGGNMTPTETCMQVDIDPHIWNTLMKQHDELLTISRQLSEKIKSIVKEDIALQDALSETQEKIGKTIHKISKDRNQLNDLTKTLVTIDAEQEDTILNERMQYLHMILWLILSVTVISLTVYTLQSYAGFIVLALIFILFFVVKWLSNK